MTMDTALVAINLSGGLLILFIVWWFWMQG